MACLTKEEQDKYVLENRGLIGSVLKNNNASIQDVGTFMYEDLFSIGTIGLVKAARMFDKDKNIKFATFATNCIQNEIFMDFRKNYKDKSVYYFENIGYDNGEGDPIAYGEMLESKENFVDDFEVKDEFESIINIILNLLTKREKVVILHSISGATQKAIGEKLNLTQPRISRLEKRIIKKIRQLYKESKNYEKESFIKKQGDWYNIVIHVDDIDSMKNCLYNLHNPQKAKVYFENEKIVLKVSAELESLEILANIVEWA